MQIRKNLLTTLTLFTVLIGLGIFFLGCESTRSNNSAQSTPVNQTATAPTTTPTPIPCNNAKFVAGMLAGIMADTTAGGLYENRKKINVCSEGDILVIQGYLSLDNRTKLDNLVKGLQPRPKGKRDYDMHNTAQDVINANSDTLRLPVGGNCSGNLVSCGDLCVPQGTCHQVEPLDPGNGNVNSNSNTNTGNTNSNVNKR